MTGVSVDVLFLSTAMAVAAGLMGCFAVMRRMSLAADALSHVALPGIGLALAMHLHPLVGAATALFFGALIVWALQEHSRAATETIVGVVFSASLAVGTMMTTGENLLEALLGQTGRPGWTETIFGAAAALGVIVFAVTQKDRLVVALVSPDIARTTGINLRRLNLIYLEMFALTIALGLRYLGVLLMGSLVIIPAAAAMRVSTHLTGMLATAAAIAAACTIAGTLLAPVIHREPGAVIVALAALVFVSTLSVRNRV